METKKRSSRISKAQKDLLVQFMEENVEFARRQFTGTNSNTTHQEMWEALAVQLNSVGPVIKKSDQWKKTWADLKNGVKKLASQQRAFMNKTGGGGLGEAPRDMNPLELKIFEIITKDSADGDGSTFERGTTAVNHPSTTIQIEPLTEITESEDESHSPPPKIARTSAQRAGYRTALEEAEKIQNELHVQLKEVLEQNSRIVSQNQEILETNRKILEILNNVFQIE